MKKGRASFNVGLEIWDLTTLIYFLHFMDIVKLRIILDIAISGAFGQILNLSRLETVGKIQGNQNLGNIRLKFGDWIFQSLIGYINGHQTYYFELVLFRKLP